MNFETAIRLTGYIAAFVGSICTAWSNGKNIYKTINDINSKTEPEKLAETNEHLATENEEEI